jgi:YegS/Rv2252/BmrU family lipid kinase
MKKIYAIINPIAGKGKSLETFNEFEIIAKKKGFKIEKVISTHEGQVIQLSSQIPDDVTDVLIFGGDGTVSETIQGLKNFHYRFTFFPVGTGNDFIKSIYEDRKLEHIIEIPFSDEFKSVNIGKLNDTRFLNISGTGIDSEILKNQVKIKKIFPGPASYIISTFYTLITYKSQKLNMVINGKTYNRSIFLISVANGKYFGGGMKIAPMAKIDDDLLEIILINKINKIKFALIFPKVFNGSYLKAKEVEHFTASSCTLKFEKEVPINVDGNLVMLKDINYQIKKEYIKIGI